ncbi:hypothetical protein AYO21_09146 [Fonsecaea monophora]|uniref:Uncharacterized protein n=1 Tax=Fonsecaea monophora TaxID=254056 RepID=A0A177EZ81_9EURO|nr:hypothetical protein AYO21_09146 [Fonsecaea monophora]KAH0829951.1 hypothetical protein FOPE_10384 [Fonsecaea pedrosoi]OAG36671.1 hypothetical protein AYO21_09146 [Fonsecaea monophora]
MSNPTAGETPSNMTDHTAVQQGAITQNEVSQEGVITEDEVNEQEAIIDIEVNEEGVIIETEVNEQGVITRNEVNEQEAIINIEVNEGVITQNEVNEQGVTQVAGDQTAQEAPLESVDDNFAAYSNAIGEINSHILSKELVAAREKLLTFTDRLINYTDVGTERAVDTMDREAQGMSKKAERAVDTMDREAQGMSKKAEYLWSQLNYSWLTLLNGQNDLMSDAMACMLIGLWTGRELFSPQHHAVTKKVSEALGRKLVSLGPRVSSEGVSPPSPLAILLFGSETSTHPLQRRCRLLGETLLALSGPSMGGKVDETMAKETAQVLETLFDRAESKFMGSEGLKIFDLGMDGVKELHSEFVWLNDLARGFRQYFSPPRPDVRAENILSVENLEEMVSIVLKHSDKWEPKSQVNHERSIWERDIIEQIEKCVAHPYHEMVGQSPMESTSTAAQ